MNTREQRFLCPHCGQKLACEDGYGGWRIQCPNCNGGVVVPLGSVVPAVTSAFWGPPPLPQRPASSRAVVAAPLGKWQQRGILVGAAILFGGLFARWFQGEWLWSPKGSTFEFQIWFGLGVLGFSMGTAHTAQSTDSLVARICGGCIIPVLIGVLTWSALGILGAGCGAACATSPRQQHAALTALFHSVLWFIGSAFLWAVVHGWLVALRRR